MFETFGRYSYCYGLDKYPIEKPNIRTGEGRMKGRGLPKGKSIPKKKWKNAKAIAKNSRRKNMR